MSIDDGTRNYLNGSRGQPDGATHAPDGTRSRVHGQVEQRLTEELRRLGQPLSADDQRMLRQSLVAEALRQEAATRLAVGQPLLSPDDERRLRAEMITDVVGAPDIQPYLADPEVTDVDINGPDTVHVTYRDGSRRRVAPVVASAKELDDLIRQMARRSGVTIEGSPTEVDISLPDGSRVTAAMGKVAPFLVVSIRVHHTIDIDRSDLVRWRMLTPELSEVLAGLARCRRNLVIGGGTGVGKTTLQAAWAHEIPAMERIVTVEDTYELGLHLDGRHSDVVPLRTCRANVEGVGEVTMLELTRLALRLNPSRVIVGEVRGGECVSLLDAMSQGNDGSCCTIHASSAMQVFTRLAKYASRAPEAPRREDVMYDIADALDVVIHLGRSARDHRPIVRSVREVTGSVESQVPASREIWRSDSEGVARRTNVSLTPELAADLVAAGLDRSLVMAADSRR
jgi:Flp pilus assembly CpaF family ATPase